MANQIEIYRKTYYDLERFLNESYFKVVESRQSEFFGDQYAILTNGEIFIRISIDRGVLGIEIASNRETSNYYDFILFYLLISKSNNLNVKLEEVGIIDFVKNNLETLSNLMTGKQLENTLIKLNELTDKLVFERFGNDIFE